MSPENKKPDNNDDQEIHSVPIPKDLYKRFEQYAKENDVTLEEAAMYYMRKGTPLLKKISGRKDELNKERKRKNIQQKRQQRGP